MKLGRLKILLVVLVTGLMLIGCVSIEQPPLKMDAGNIPDGHAVLFIAVPFSEPANDRFAFMVRIGNDDPIVLEGMAVNRIYIPEGEYYLLLERLEQSRNNRNTVHIFDAGTSSQLVLVERSSDDGYDVTTNFELLPSKRYAFEEIIKKNSLKLVPLILKTR